ncbi:MAG: regulatory protein RecX [Verrucomicrobiota bacterium]
MSDPLDNCRERAIRLLDQRMHTELELRKKLRTKGFAADNIDQVLADFTRLGLVDDRQYAETYCREKLEGSRPVGPLKLRNELRKRGVAADIIRDVLANWEETEDGETDLTRAIRAGEAKLRLIKPGTPRRDAYARICRFLAGRGFPPPLCRDAAEHILNNQNWPDNTSF